MLRIRVKDLCSSGVNRNETISSGNKYSRTSDDVQSTPVLHCTQVDRSVFLLGNNAT